MLKTNENQLVALSVIGEIASPTLKQNYRIQPISGEPVQLPSVGGITYNASLGDSAIEIAADHIEPDVSIRNSHEASNKALNTLSCIGNVAKVVSGDGKGLEGWVIGKHGGVEHVMIHFPQRTDLDRLTIGDRIQIRAYGTGLKLLDHPEITLMNLDPRLLPKLFMRDSVGPKEPLSCAVTHIIPAHLLGAGLGEETCQSGDVDIQLFDEQAVNAFHLNTLRFGDVVAMENCDHRYGRIYRQGWISVGIVTHSCSIQAGHGPGVTTILTAPQSALTAYIESEANLSAYLKK